MGNVLRKIDLDQTLIDGGQVKSGGPPPMVTLTNGVRVRDPNAHDVQRVAKMIVGRRMAPFYEGAFEAGGGDGASRASTLRRRTSSVHSRATSSAGAARQQQPKDSKKTKKSKRSDSKNDLVDKKWLTQGLVECPICYLWYPRNINVTKCCGKNMCTQCFVSMKRPTQHGRLIGCPFCRASNLTVVYKPPAVLLGLTSKYHRSGTACEEIRPVRMQPVAQHRPQGMYYSRYPGTGVQQSTAFAVPQSTSRRYQWAYYTPSPQLARPTAGAGPSYPARYYYSSAAAQAANPSPSSTTRYHVSRQAAPARPPSLTGSGQATAAQARAQQQDEQIFQQVLRLSMVDY